MYFFQQILAHCAHHATKIILVFIPNYFENKIIEMPARATIIIPSVMPKKILSLPYPKINCLMTSMRDWFLIFNNIFLLGREWWLSGWHDESSSGCHQFHHVSYTLWGATSRDGPRRRDTKRFCLLWWSECWYVLLYFELILEK